MAGNAARAGGRAALWGLIGALTPALVDLSTSGWFGARDLAGLLLLTLPFLVVLVLGGIALARKMAARPTWAGLAIGGAAGAGLGFLWTLSNALLFGSWFGAWSVPVLACWTTGGALGLAAAATTRSAPGWRRVAVESIAYLLVAAGALHVYRPAVVLLQRDQHLTFVYGRFGPHPTALVVDDSRDFLPPEDEELLTRAGLTGSIQVLGYDASYTTERPRATMVVLLARPVDRVYRLPQPDATAVLYIQEAGGFRRFPADAKVLADRMVELYPAGTETGYWIERSGGGRSGGSIAW